jgi:hypothetical protein
MTTGQLIIVCTTVLAALLVTHELVKAALANRLAITRAQAAATIRTPPAGSAPSRIGHRVTVHTKQPDERTLFGVLAGDYTDRITLEDAEYVTTSGATPLPGTQHVATRDIAWIDVHALVTAVPDHAPAGEPLTIEG